MKKSEDRLLYQQKVYTTNPETRYSLLYISILIVSLSTFIIGYDTVIISSALVYVRDYFHLTAGDIQLLVSSILISAIFGALFGWPFCQAIGRKKSQILSALLFLIGSVFVFFAPRYPIILIGRFIIGLGLGLVSMAALIYLSEIVPTKIRGSSVCFLNFVYNLGIFFAFLTGLLFNQLNSWRWILASSFAPALLFFYLLFKIPETPQWFLFKGRKKQAEKELKRLRRHLDVYNEIEAIEENLENEKNKWKNFWSPGVFKALFIGSFLAIFMEATGMDAIFYYAPLLLKTIGSESTQTSIASGLVIAASSLIFSFVAILFIDWWGRRKLLLLGLSVMFFGLVLLIITLKYEIHLGTRNWMMLGSLVIFSAGFSLGIGTVGWLLISEIFPLKIRAFAVGMTLTLKWFANYLIASHFLTTLSKIGLHRTFWIYALITIFAWAFVYLFVPETAGKSLETIEAFWLESKNHGTKIES